MKLRKLIAIFSAVMLLCAAVPVCVSAAASDITTNFDNGSRNGWGGTCSADAAYSGAYGVTATGTGSWAGLINKTADLEKYTTYKLSFWWKSNADAVKNAAFEMKYTDAAGTSLKQPLMNKGATSISLPATNTTWTQETLYFTTGDYTSVQFLFYRGSGTAGDAASICVDEIELTEVTDIDNDGYIVDGGFESGTLNYSPNSTGTITTDAYSGNYAVTGQNSTKYTIYVQKYVRVEKNTDYTFTFYAKSSGSGKIARVYVNKSKFSSTSSNDLRGNYSQHTVNTAWEKQTVTFNSGDATEVALTLCSSGSTATYYFDDLYLDGPSNYSPEQPEEPGDEPGEPQGENLLVNPGIETGDTTGWTYSGTSASNEQAHSGSYALKSGNSVTEWHSMVKQVVSVSANTDYTYSLWYYYAGTNANASFHAMVNDPSGTSIVSYHVKNMTPNTWNQVTVTFNSGSNTSVTVYAKNGTANDGGIYYFDDLLLASNGATEPDEPDVPAEPEGNEEIPSNTLVTNGGFENGNAGWTLYQGSTASANAKYVGNNGLHAKGTAWNGIANQTVTTVVGKSYRLSFWYKINVAGFNWKVTGEVTGTQYAGTWFNTDLGVWKKAEAEFVADDTRVNINFLGLNESTSPDFYLDNVVLIEVPGPSNDGFILNGDFETGKTTGWEIYQGTTVTSAAAKSGNYGVNLKGNGGWGGMLKQSFKTTKGLKYTLTLDVKVNTYGTNVQVMNTADDARLASAWITDTSWKTYTYNFTAMSTDTYLNFCGGGNGAAAGVTEDVYVDNIKIVEIPCEHEYDSIQDDDCNICGLVREVPLVDIVEGGQTSASEDVKGLAFRFELEATGATIDNNNKYVAGSASIKPFGNDEYTLVAMGAVITNKADKATEELLNLNTVNGKSIINIDAIYLLESDADSLAFATRIVNIPEAGESTNIYARAYYVFERDGETIVIYDDIVSQNYTAAIG